MIRLWNSQWGLPVSRRAGHKREDFISILLQFQFPDASWKKFPKGDTPHSKKTLGKWGTASPQHSQVLAITQMRNSVPGGRYFGLRPIHIFPLGTRQMSVFWPVHGLGPGEGLHAGYFEGCQLGGHKFTGNSMEGRIILHRIIHGEKTLGLGFTVISLKTHKWHKYSQSH